MKKLITALFVTMFLCIPNAQAEEVEGSGEFPIAEIETLTGDALEGYNYIEYDEPVTIDRNGSQEVLLGYYDSVNQASSSNGSITPQRAYYEYDRWYVYDQGIVKHWSYLSNPYFIRSVARGMTYEKTTEVSATISATYSSGIPSASKPSVNKSFGLTSSGSKKVTVKVTLSGPGKGYSSRDFYYKKGRHTHKVKIVREHRSNCDGVLWKKTYYGQVGKPAIKYYSVDRK